MNIMYRCSRFKWLEVISVLLFFTVLGQHTSKSNRREISQNSKIQQSLSRTSGLTRGHRYVFRGLWVQNTIPGWRRFLGLFFTNWLRDHSNGKGFLVKSILPTEGSTLRSKAYLTQLIKPKYDSRLFWVFYTKFEKRIKKFEAEISQKNKDIWGLFWENFKEFEAI